MAGFGYEIMSVLIDDIVPDKTVADSMNAINAAQRHLVATRSTADADKLVSITKAEAVAETMRLEGVGVAEQRKAIVEGLSESLSQFSEKHPGVTPEVVMNLMMMTQYFDAIKCVASSSNSNTILMPHQPGAITDLMAQFQVLNSSNNLRNSAAVKLDDQ